MTAHTTLSKDLTSLVSELEAHISANGLADIGSDESFVPLIDLGSPAALTSSVPSLADLLNDIGLTLKTTSLYMVSTTELVSSLNVPYMIIPIRSNENADLVLHEVNEGAVPNASSLGYSYYLPESTTDQEIVPLSHNTIHLVTANAYHSFRYSVHTSTFINTPENFVLLLMITVNEDLSGYFS